MTETKIVLTVTHKKPLPPLAVEMMANRIYGYLYSQGVEAGVNAEVVKDEKDAPAREPLTNRGHGHVYLRADGVKARCGGPVMCRECALDAAGKAEGL